MARERRTPPLEMREAAFSCRRVRPCFTLTLAFSDNQRCGRENSKGEDAPVFSPLRSTGASRWRITLQRGACDPPTRIVSLIYCRSADRSGVNFEGNLSAPLTQSQGHSANSSPSIWIQRVGFTRCKSRRVLTCLDAAYGIFIAAKKQENQHSGSESTGLNLARLDSTLVV